MSQLQRQRLWQRLTEAGIPAGMHQALLDAGRLLQPASTQPLRLSHWITTQTTLFLDGSPLPPVPPRRYWLYHKPVGLDCNVRPQDPASIAALLQTLPAGVFAVGRLDKDSCGLLLLTNDGAFAQQLLHPQYHHQKTYQVTVDKPVQAEMLQQFEQGLRYQDGHVWHNARPCQARLLAEDVLELQLTEGKNRQIRYMCRQLGLKVIKLERVKIGALTGLDLQPGQLQELTAAQVVLATGSDVGALISSAE